MREVMHLRLQQKVVILLLLLAVFAAGCSSRGPATPPPDTGGSEASAPAVTTPDTPAVPEGGAVYAAVREESSVSYAVGETFLGQNLNVTAVGSTSAVSGTINVNADGTIAPSVIQVDLSTLRSDEDRRDNRVRQALDTRNYPLATFAISGAAGDPVLADGETVPIELAGQMTIKGTERPLVFTGTATRSGSTLTVDVESTFLMTDFGVTPPNIAGFVSVRDETTVHVRLTARLP